MTRDRNAVLDRVQRELPVDPDAFRRLEERSDRRAVRRRVAGGVVGVSLTVAIVAGLASVTGSDEIASPIPVATGDPDARLTAATGEYYYVRLSSGGTTNERWYGPDGSGRFTTSIDGAVVDDRSFEPGELTGKLYSALPEDPVALIAHLRDRSAPDGPSPISIATPAPSLDPDEAVLLAMADLLGYGSDYLVPEQAAAVFRAASTMQGVVLDDGVDPLGREATTLSWNFRDEDSVILVRWYFEPTTHQFMGEQRFDSATGGGLLGRQVVEVAGIARSTDDRPSPAARYVPRVPAGTVEAAVSAVGTPDPRA